MQFHRRAIGQPTTLGILPGTFNPLTVAHLALAEAGLRMVDEVLFVLPRELPHKTWSGASHQERFGLHTPPAVLARSFLVLSLAECGAFAEGWAPAEEGLRMAEAAKGQRPSQWLSTHPSEETRIEQIRGWLPEALTYYRPAK